MMYLLHSVLFLLLILLKCLAQAPGDTGTYCKDISALPDYPDTVKPLVDSWSYKNLLIANGGPWTSLDLDNDTTHHWSAVPGEECREKLRVNEPQSVPQNNWIITQYINKSIPSQYNTNTIIIYVNISYILDSSCSVMCSTNFHILYRLANQTNQSVANDTKGYTMLANVTSSDDTTIHSARFMFELEPQNQGFYIGLHDRGANITITRLFVYLLIGPAMQVYLTLFPETPAPASDCVSVLGTCVANANTKSGNPPTLRLDPNGNWTFGEQCFCIEGHEPIVLENEQQCQACSVNTYKSMLSNTACKSCPSNSASTMQGASICPCNNRYYRAPIETAEVGCTAPPSAPQGVITSQRTNISIVITWTKPQNSGGRSDVFYNILVRTSQNFSYPRQDNTEPVINTSYHLTSLIPFTFHYVEVVAENGVSNQSSNQERKVSVSFTTNPGIPLHVTGVRVVNDEFVEWSPLVKSDRGPIIKYQVKFFSTAANENIIDVDSNDVLYQVNITKDFPPHGQPVHVAVRGFTSAGGGPWSSSVIFAEINPLAPSVAISSTTTSSTAHTTVSMTTSSTLSVGASISGGTVPTPTKTTPTTNPPSGGTSPLVSIGAVLGGVAFIIILLTLGALGYYVFRKIRDKKTEETDYEQLIKYEVPSGDDDEGGAVHINPFGDS